jgi:hypothetical protein
MERWAMQSAKASTEKIVLIGRYLVAKIHEIALPETQPLAGARSRAALSAD